MSTNRIIDEIKGLLTEVDNLKDENTELKQRKIDATKFYAATLTVEAISSLHNVHPDTVRKYVAMGCIEKHPDSTDAKILVRASEALTLDFKEMRRRSHARF